MKTHVYFIIGLTLVKFNYAFFDGFVRVRFDIKDLKGLNVSSVNISKQCGAGEKCIWKCCPEGQMMSIFKTCKTSDIRITNVTVYDQHRHRTNKSLNDVFKLIPNLMKDEIFARNALWWYMTYLIEDGRLFLKLPNLYNRWKEIQTNRFCVDMKEKQSRPIFMVEYEIDYPREPSVFKKCGLIVSTLCLLVILGIYAMVRELMDVNGIILMIHFGCLIITFITHSILESYSTMTLRTLQVLTLTFFHYFFKVSSFTWTNVMFYRILVASYRTKEVPVSKIRQLAKYCAYSFGLSLFMTVFTATIELSDMSDTPSFVTPQIHKDNFTFHAMESLYYLYYPLIILLTFNWIVCFVKAIEFCKKSKQFAVVSGNGDQDDSFNRPMQFVKLLTLLSAYVVVEMLTVIFLKGTHDTSAVYSLCIGPIILIIFLWNKNVLSLLSIQYKTYKRKDSQSNHLVTFFQKK